MSPLVKQSDHFSETAIDEEIVVMRLDNGEFYSLTGTAAATWRLIDGTRNRADLLEALAADYGIADSEIAADVDDFLAQLMELGLIATT